MMLKLAALVISASFMVHPLNGLAAERSAETTSKNRSNAKKKTKASVSKKTASKFNPSTFLKNKNRDETNISADNPHPSAPTEVASGKQAVVCKPAIRSNEPCTGSECTTKAPVQVDPVEKPVAMIENNEAITQEVMKTIRENCAPPESDKSFVKPVFELGIKEPEKGTTDKREMIPKVGIQAAF